MVGNVLVEAFPDDFCLEEKGLLSLGYSRGPALLLGPPYLPSSVILCMKGFQVDCTWLLCLLDCHRLQQEAWTLEAGRRGLIPSSVTDQLCDPEQVPPLGLFLHL